MAHYLVVANQTLGGEQLMQEIRKRITSEPSSFYVIVPEGPASTDRAVQPERAAPGGMRLQLLLAHIRLARAEVDGAVGPTDPLAAMESAMSHGPFDEIIISTRPTGVSEWLRLDVPHRAARRFGLPVTTVYART